jgi:hypothetical protein
MFNEEILINCICHLCKTPNSILLKEDILSYSCTNCYEKIISLTKKSGYIYVLSNPSIPHQYKIGFSLLSPESRIEQLSNSTSIPSKFESELFFYSEDARLHEREIHEILSDSRSNQNREFFQANLFEIYTAIKQVTGKSPLFYRVNSLEENDLKKYNPWFGLNLANNKMPDIPSSIRCSKCGNLTRNSHPKIKQNGYGYCIRCKISFDIYGNPII